MLSPSGPLFSCSVHLTNSDIGLFKKNPIIFHSSAFFICCNFLIQTLQLFTSAFAFYPRISFSFSELSLLHVPRHQTFLLLSLASRFGGVGWSAVRFLYCTTEPHPSSEVFPPLYIVCIAWCCCSCCLLVSVFRISVLLRQLKLLSYPITLKSDA